MTSTAIKTAGEHSTGNTDHLNLTVTLAQAWARDARRNKRTEWRRQWRKIGVSK